MGLKLFSSGSEICNQGVTKKIGPETKTKPNPNPYRFSLRNLFNSKDYVMLVVNYDDATTYDGDKILIYKRSDEGEVLGMLQAKNLDPHFLEDKVSPIARFVATEEGIGLAMKFINS